MVEHLPIAHFNDVISDLRFQSSKIGQDTLEIHVEYIDCVENGGHDTSCVTTALSKRIQIVVNANDDREYEFAYDEFPYYLLMGWFVYPCIYFAYTELRILGYQCIRRVRRANEQARTGS